MIVNKITQMNKKVLLLLSLASIYIVVSLVYFKLNNKDNDTELISGKISEMVYNKSILLVEMTVYDNTVGKIVWDGLTMSELIQKLNRSLNSTLAGKGDVFATHALELGLDPYLAVAITLQETGCEWDCSYLVKACNNVGGQKGSPGCDGGSYKAYNTIDEGIIGYLDNLYYNYYLHGLTTPEAMNLKYAESSSWAYKVNSYIEKIKAA